jgi:hypothetical protein
MNLKSLILEALEDTELERRIQDLLKRKKNNAASLAYHHNRFNRDIGYTLKIICRNRFHDFIKSKGKISFGKYVKMDYEKLKDHLESLFKDGMSWKNRNKWHIDHIRPLASFNFINDDGSINQRALNKAWKITNLQPLWDKENMSKGAKILIKK